MKPHPITYIVEHTKVIEQYHDLVGESRLRASVIEDTDQTGETFSWQQLSGVKETQRCLTAADTDQNLLNAETRS